MPSHAIFAINKEATAPLVHWPTGQFTLINATIAAPVPGRTSRRQCLWSAAAAHSQTASSAWTLRWRMSVTHLLYLHGFRSSPLSAKARTMAETVRQRYPGVVWWCPQLPPSPRQAMHDVATRLAAWPGSAGFEAMAVVGSSLGGFYATWVAETMGWSADRWRILSATWPWWPRVTRCWTGAKWPRAMRKRSFMCWKAATMR
jgi:hypothetical protein